MDRDPYVVLGLAPDSEPGEWKRAYRRLAMRWHPDRNDHPEATERFKEISAAYERLIAVDAPETEENEAAPEASPASPENETPRAADIRLNLELGLEEAAAGCRKTVHYTRGKACRTCDGSGEAGLSRTRFCEACHGSGRIRDAARVLVPCDACGGRGFFSERICPDCTGSGRETTAHSLEINVPPGMLPGDELRLGGQGEAGDSERAAGDLYLTVVLASHPLFRLDGRDLHYRMPVDGLALIVGSEIELAVPGGRVKHRLAPGKPELREIRLPGQGYPGRGKKAAGDLVVQLEPVFPEQWSNRQRKFLEQARADLLANAEDSLPAVAEWWRAAPGEEGAA